MTERYHNLTERLQRILLDISEIADTDYDTAELEPTETLRFAVAASQPPIDGPVVITLPRGSTITFAEPPPKHFRVSATVTVEAKDERDAAQVTAGLVSDQFRHLPVKWDITEVPS